MSAQSVSRSLSHFFGAYFHEDWDLEADDWKGIVDGYVRDEEPSSDLLRLLATEIDDLNAVGTEDDVAGLVTRTLGANYYPLPEVSYREWLSQVAAWLRQHAAAIDGGPTPPTG
ncbi:contact-dependent growth inhibition system immunity protein [Mycobacterium sp. pV006]|uniref:contact-dependent growth inhibition system immunity protein n=1 Tax=Mycobacterium sp. pV006 TaxID=3238983 RepID=UPI00351AB3E1